MTTIEPGWYKDPADPTTQRYWDGGGWQGDPIPADAPAPDGPPAVPAPPAASAPPVAPATPATPATPTTSSPPAAGPATRPPGGGPPDGAPPGYPPPSGGPSQSPPRPGPAPWDGAAGARPPGRHAAGPPPPDQPGSGHPAPGQPAFLHPVPGYGVPAARPNGYTLAPYPARLVARIIDFLVVLGLNLVVNAWFAWQYVQEIAPIFRDPPANPFTDPPQTSPRSQYLIWVILIIATALWMAYEVPALGNTGQTLGKRIMHIKVMPVEGDKPLGFGRAFRRWGRLGLWTPLWSCCVGFIFQFIDSVSLLFDRQLRQAFHDKAARTVVVQVQPAPPGATPAGGAADRSPGGNQPTGGPR